MPKELIHVDTSDRGRLRCDSPECGHVLPDALPWSSALIGYPCPKCASNMLTREDYEASENAMRVYAWINKWLGPIFGRENLATDPKAVNVRVRHHAGKTTVTLPEK